MQDEIQTPQINCNENILEGYIHNTQHAILVKNTGISKHLYIRELFLMFSIWSYSVLG